MSQEDLSLFGVNPEVIVIKPRELTPREKVVQVVSGEASNRLRANLATTSSLADFILNYYAIRTLFLTGSIDWMWDYGEPNVDDVIASFATDSFRAQTEEDARVTTQMAPLLQSLEDRPDSFKMALRRLRDPHRNYSYAVLTEYPRGIQATNPVEGFSPLEQTQVKPDMIYFRPTTACVLHACDDLFKMQRQEPFYVPYRTRQEALQRMEYDERGINEYQLEKTAQGAVKQEAENYILVGVHFAFSNEPYVTPVSRFI